jgi:AhpD family alkylhydroperoxidase
LTELVRTLPGLAGSYGRHSALDPRSRQRIILAVTEVNGCRYSAWIHGAWQAFLGEIDEVEATAAMLRYARACAEAGRPVPTDELGAILPGNAVRAVRATVAHTEVSNLVGNSFDSVVGQLTGKRRFSPLGFAFQAAAVGAAAPLAVPLFATAGLMRLANSWAPPMPVVEMPESSDPNLLAHLLATAAPTYMANAAARLVVLGLPSPIAIGVRSGRTSATVRVGRRALVVENGITSDAIAVIEGEVEPLLELATGSIVRELGAIRLRGQ